MGITARGAWESGPPALPRARDRLPERGLHLRRRRRHERRRVRQRDAAERAHPAGRCLRPPRHLPRPDSGRGDVVRRAEAAVRAAALQLGRLRRVADLRRAAESSPAASSRSRSTRRSPRRWASTRSVTAMTPQQLMKAILLAPVDLLWNGGIGTYVKAATETHAEAGDKANDPIRVNGGELRCAAVGEGGNLGLTQRGRIEYAQSGGRINTDFIDNSAGVDTSDHEVNIKILLDEMMASGDMTEKQRNALLASMTDEVGRLVLADNYGQNLALASSEAVAAPADARARELDPPARDAGPDRPRDRVPAVGEGVRSPPAAGHRAHRPGAVGAAGVHQDRAGRRAARRPTCPTTRSSAPSCTTTSRAPCASSTASRWTCIRCAARSSSPRSSTGWSTSPASRSSTGSARRRAPARRSWRAPTSSAGRSTGPTS